MPFPYTATSSGLVSTIRQLRSAFPAQVTAETLRRWSIAPNNESYIINILKFLGVIDDEGKKKADTAKAFLEHDEKTFQKKLDGLLTSAYASLYEHFGTAPWSIDRDKLIGFFRTADESSSVVGQRQASTYLVLAGLAGHGEVPEPQSGVRKPTRQSDGKKDGAARAVAARKPGSSKGAAFGTGGPESKGMSFGGVTVRVEINLPVTDDQDVYDKIFKSLRANLIDAK